MKLLQLNSFFYIFRNVHSKIPKKRITSCPYTFVVGWRMQIEKSSWYW